MEDRLDKRRPWNTNSSPLPTKPMRKLFATLLLTSFAMPLHAQRSATPTPIPSKVSATAEKPARPRTFLQRIFGPSATTPTPTPTPAPVVKHYPKPKPKLAPDETPAVETAKVTPKVHSTETAPATTATTKPKTGKGSGKKGTPANAETAALDDATKFKNAKAKALEDVHIRELKSKADGEVDEAAAHKALVNYNRALFEKIREVDPSVSSYAGKVEQAMTKRIGAEKAKE
jgi:hypothetical protein